MPPVSQPLPRCTPESVGVPSQAILDFLDAIEAKSLELHGMVLTRRGQVFAEGWWHPFTSDRPHLLYSLSKSFCSTGIGMLVDEGRLSLDDKVVSFFPDETPADASENLKAMRVRDLLTMTAGHETDDMSELYGREDNDWPRGFLQRPVPRKPGTHFVYNTSATYMCSAILTRVTGESLFTYLTPRLFEPLGFEGHSWTTDPKGTTFGGSGLSIRTEDIAKFGLLLLQKGIWNGQRLVSEAWLQQATSKQVPNGPDPNNDWNQGYGFQFWRCRHNCYRGDGAFGQYCIVIDETGMVVSIHSSVDDMGAVMQAVWDHLRYAPQETSIQDNQAKHAELLNRLANLEVKGPKGEPTSPMAKRVSGQTYHNDDKESNTRTVKFEFDDRGGAMVTIDDAEGFLFPAIGGDHWDVHSAAQPNVVVALRGAWTAPDTYTVATRCMEGPETRTFTCHFTDNKVTCQELRRGYFGPPEGRHFDGTIQP